MIRLLFLISFAGCLVTTSRAEADWRQFRGTDTRGYAADEQPPTTWSDTDNLAWRVDLPGRGLSSPIVVGERVYVTASSGYRQDRLHVLCYAAESGQLVWERQFWATGRTTTHPKTCVAAPTPCSDGERIFATFSTNDVACLDREGNLLWFRGLTYDFPNASNSLGMSSSPVVAGDTLICMAECDAESFSTGLDAATGVSRWKIDRPRKANWTSPALWLGETPEETRVLVQSAAGVASLDPRSGEIAWNYPDGASTIPSLVASGQVAYVPSHGITALKPSPSNPAVPEIVWRVDNLGPGTASPTIVEETLYVLNRAGVLIAANTHDGQRKWQLRLRGPFSGSPVVAGDHLYLFSEEGLGQCVQLGEDSGELVGEHNFNETILATPAVSGNAVYIRSDGHLWKIAEKK